MCRLISRTIASRHGRLTECFEGSGGSAVAATYIIIAPSQRGTGLGSVLMRLLEVEATSLGYHYVYLWTHVRDVPDLFPFSDHCPCCINVGRCFNQRRTAIAYYTASSLCGHPPVLRAACLSDSGGL